MPHLDTGNQETDGVDYSSFEYQHVLFQHDQNRASAGGSNSGLTQTVSGIEPLEDRGGLDTNEVAELVAIMDPQVVVGGDNFEDETNNEVGAIDFRGAFGVDLDAETDQVFDSPFENDATELNEEDGGTVRSSFANYKTDPALLHSFNVTASTGYRDSASGTGGGGNDHTVTFDHKPYRQLTGRGPVVDSSDDMTLVSTVIKNNVSYVAECSYRASLVWDIASVDEAGRRFGIPS